MISRIGSKTQGSRIPVCLRVCECASRRVFLAHPLTRSRVHPEPCPHPARGFTLIEVLIAVSILAVGLVGVLRAYSTSAMAMEKVQYDLDAVYLLKIAMGQAEEKMLVQGEIVPGASGGAFEPDDVASLGVKRSGRWIWSQNVRKMDIPVKQTIRETSGNEEGFEVEKKPNYYLSELKLAVVNSLRIPPREVGLETYVGSDSVKSS